MNRHLLAGASALALLAGASAANAQATFTISGDTRVDFFSTNLETGKTAAGANVIEDARTTDFAQRGRVNIIATAKTDSGLTYGWRHRIRIGAAGANSGNAPITADQSWLFVNGSFGQVVMGTTGGVYDSTYGAADGWGTGGPDGNFSAGIAPSIIPAASATVTAYNAASNKSLLGSSLGTTRAYYLTPEFSGFTAGIGYAPTVQNVGNDVIFDKNAIDYNDVVELMARYQTDFDGGKVELWAGYNFGEGKPGTTATNNGKTEDLSAFALAGRLTFGPARLSVHYANAGKSGQQKISAAGVRNTALADATSLSAYVDYAVMPELTIGAAYAIYEAAGDVNVAGKTETKVTSIGAAYTIAPGLSLRPELNFVDYKNKEAGARDYDGVVAIFRTFVNF